MLRRIKLYGQLAKFVGKRTLRAEVASAAEAVRFLIANFPGIEQHMAERHYKVLVGDYALALDELHDPSGQQEIKIVPAVVGAGAVGRILAGAALIALAIAVPGLGGGVAATIFGTQFSALSLAVGGLGASLLLGGVTQLLTPMPTMPKTGKDSDSDPGKSYAFSGIQNTSRQGVPVPIIFGEVVTGSITISAGIDIDEA